MKITMKMLALSLLAFASLSNAQPVTVEVPSTNYCQATDQPGFVFWNEEDDRWDCLVAGPGVAVNDDNIAVFDGNWYALHNVLPFSQMATDPLWENIINWPTTLAEFGLSSEITTLLGGYVTSSAMTTGMAGKMNTNPGGSTGQYVRGNGSLASFPSIPVISAQAHINDAATNAAVNAATNAATDAATNAATNAPTNLNVLTTLLGSLTGEVNATNTKQNDLAGKYNELAAKYNAAMTKTNDLAAKHNDLAAKYNDLATKFATYLDAGEANGMLTP